MNIESNIRILRWYYFLVGFIPYAPFAVLYYSEISGSFALGMSIFSIEMVSSALFEIPTGIFSDRIGRKNTIVLGAISALAYTTTYALASSYQFLVLGAIIAGLTRSFYSGNNYALLHDTLLQLGHKDGFSKYMGKLGTMEHAALALSGIAGGFISLISIRAAFMAAIIPQLGCLILSFRLVEPTIHSDKSGNIFNHLAEAAKQFRTNKKLRLLSFASTTTYALTESSFQFRAAFYSLVWPVWAIGAAQTLTNILASTSFHHSDKILKKIGDVRSLILGNVYGRLMNITAVLFPSIISPLLMSSTSIMYGPLTVAKESLLQKEFKSEQRATMGSLNSFVGSILFGIVSYSLGTIADILNPQKAIFLTQVLIGCTIIFYILIGKHDKKEDKVSM